MSGKIDVEKYKFKAVVEFEEITDFPIITSEKDIEEMVGDWVKVKSGRFNNAVTGYITKVYDIEKYTELVDDEEE